MDQNMTSDNLDNLVRVGRLKKESVTQSEFDSLVMSARKRLDDAKMPANSYHSRFVLAYGAAHSLSLAALHWHGYRSGNRYIVFQVLPHTLGLDASVWRVLAKAHNHRNVAEYEGHLEEDEQLLADMIASTEKVYESVVALGAVPKN
ncbi:MAG: hypothetical protein ACR2PR_01505 [Pseudohongiellaceae bacterium]